MNTISRRPMFYALVVTIPVSGIVILLGVWAMAGRPPVSGSDIEARLQRIEKQLAVLAAQPRQAAPRFVLDPSRPASAGLDEAVAALSRQVAELRGPSPELRSPSPWELASSQDAGARQRAVKRLQQLAKTDPEALQQLRRFLADSDGRVRREALDALRKVGDPSALGDVLALVGDADSRVREEAARTAGRLADRSKDPAEKARASQSLQAALRDKSFAVQEQAIEALGRSGDVSTIAGLRQAYGDGTGPNALEAAVALKQLGDGTAFQKEAVRLRGLLDHGGGTSDEKREALDLLVKHAPEESRAAIDKGLRDPSESVRREAQQLLEKSSR